MNIRNMLLAGAALFVAPTQAMAVVEYACGAQGGADVFATLFDEEDIVVVRYVSFHSGEAVEEVFRPAVTGSGFRYLSDTGSEFYGQGDVAFLLSPGSEQLGCVITRVIAPGDGQQLGGGVGTAGGGGIPVPTPPPAPAPADPPSFVAYNCPNPSSLQIYVTIFPDRDVAVLDVTDVNGTQTLDDLFPQVTGSGFRYAGADATFEGSGPQSALLTYSNGYQVSCDVTQIIAPAGIGAPAAGQNPNAQGQFASAISFGGNLREGPGTQFAGRGATYNGQPLTLLSNTEVYLDGFSWWLVRLADGQEAYQWGGLLCTQSFGVSGVHTQGC